MTGSPHAHDNRDRCLKEDTISRSDPPPSGQRETVQELQLAVVKYDENPDRGTIYPKGLTGIERMETWISADMTAFFELSACR